MHTPHLIQAQANVHKELSFHQVVRPAIDIQTERQTDLEYNEFWEPIIQGKLGELFARKSVFVYKGGWLGKTIRDDIEVYLVLTKRKCYIELYFYEANSTERRDEVMELFSKPDYNYKNTDTSQYTKVKFPVLNKGKNDRDDWPEIREKLVSMGTDIYNKINESDT